MTTYHEPPLQSRRAARQSERAEKPPFPVVEPTLAAIPPRPVAQDAVPQSRAEARARLAAAASPESAPEAVERTLTRRELRAIREQQGSAATAPASSQTDAGHGRRAAGLPAGESRPASGSVAAPGFPPALVPPPPAAPPASAGSAPEPPVTRVVPPAAPIVPPPPAPAASPVEILVEPAPPAPAPPTPVAMPDPALLAPPPAGAPIGHWSRQADEDALFAGTVATSRNVGGGSSPITTSALILPPAGDAGIDGPMSSTGEIFITGSIQLPRSLAAHGARPEQLEATDLDHLLDPDDDQVTSTDSQPVRATRAVSTHTGSAGVISAQKPPSNRGLTILIIAAGTMAALVGTILVVALASGQL